MFFLYAVGTAKTLIDVDRAATKAQGVEREGTDWTKVIVDGLNNCLPRYKDLDKLTTKLLMHSLMTAGDARAADRIEYPSWGSAIGVSLGFIVLMLLLSYWRFATRDG
jgi:hypothetical protein